MIREELECDGLAQLEIVGSIYLAHAPFAQQADNAISVKQDRAGHKPSVVDGIVRLCGGLNRRLVRIEELRNAVELSSTTWAGRGIETDLFRTSGTVEVTRDHRARILTESRGSGDLAFTAQATPIR